MLNGISWGSFLEGTALLCIIYYAVIGLKYYRQGIKKILQNKSTVKKDVAVEDKLEPLDPLMPQIYDLMTGIKEFMQKAANDDYINTEIVFGLQQILNEYPELKVSRFVASINNEIQQLSNDLLREPLDASELENTWK